MASVVTARELARMHWQPGVALAKQSTRGTTFLINAIWITSAVLVLSEDRVNTGLSVAGIAVFVLGATIRVIAHSALRHEYSRGICAIEDHRLVSSGVYGILRHPLHFGMCLEVVGMSIVVDRPYADWVLVLSMLVVVCYRNRLEDLFLERLFGRRFRDYQRASWDLVDLVVRK